MSTERLMPGEQVDEFLVWERLHAGAQGLIYRVTGVEPDFPLIMKVPRSDNAESLISYETEAKILPALRGPHVPRFVAAGDVQRVPYLVLEQIKGESLEARVAGSPLEAAEVMEIGAAVADALHAIHEQGCVHCDLKPDNVIVSGEIAVLIDFGLAWHERFPDLLAEEERFAAGSGPYISPEQLRGIRGDPRSDVFSVGVILYELATGELPFGMPNTTGGMRQRLWMDPDPPKTLEPEIAPAFQEIILRCLEPDPASRYQSAAHVAFDLRNPAQVRLTERAQRTKCAGFFKRTQQWWNARNGRASPARQSTPVIMVAVDTTHQSDRRQPAIHRATRQVLSLSDEFRLVCVSVVAAEESHLEHMRRLAEWTKPLGLPAERLSLHVLMAADPASALSDYAKRNHVDLIVLGAPRPGQQPLAWMRSVASGVTANAPCSVHVVRVPA